MRIFVFGGSSCYGAWDTEFGGWIERLKSWVHKKSDMRSEHYVYNLGVPANTVKQVLERFDAEVKERLRLREPDFLFFFHFGSNDAALTNGSNTTPIKEYKEHLQELYTKAKSLGKVCALGTTHVDESKVNPLPWNTRKSIQNKEIVRYNDALQEVCKENTILFIPLIKIDLCKDGLHPNTDGHKQIYELVKRNIEPEI